MTIKVEMLRCFCAVAEAGNLADAANRLGRTQSAVSMTLKQLEENLGNRLFQSDRKNRLTELGEQVFQLGQQQLANFDTTVDAISLLARSPQGVVRIAAVPSIAALAFPAVVRHLATRHPGAKIELRDADTNNVLDALVKGWADIGIASTGRALNGVVPSLLFSDRFGLVLSGAHQLASGGSPIHFDDIRDVPLLRNGLCDQIQSPEIQDHLLRMDVTVHNTQSLLSMVREGDWATLLPYSTLRLAPEGLVFRLIADLPDTRQVYLYVRAQVSSPEVVRDAVAFISSIDWPNSD